MVGSRQKNNTAATVGTHQQPSDYVNLQSYTQGRSNTTKLVIACLTSGITPNRTIFRVKDRQFPMSVHGFLEECRLVCVRADTSGECPSYLTAPVLPHSWYFSSPATALAVQSTPAQVDALWSLLPLAGQLLPPGNLANFSWMTVTTRPGCLHRIAQNGQDC